MPVVQFLLVLISCWQVYCPQVLIRNPLVCAEALAKRNPVPTASSSWSQPSERIPGDGRCLFQTVAHGGCLRAGRPAPDESTQRQIADDLRNKALDELLRRRETSEWFIEGDFDAYVRRMRIPHTWGGEPELLMLSNVFEMPITVDMRINGGLSLLQNMGKSIVTVTSLGSCIMDLDITKRCIYPRTVKCQEYRTARQAHQTSL